MDCSQINDPGWLTETLCSGQPSAETRVLNCFFECCYDPWCKMAYKNILIRFPRFPPETEEELLSDAFNDGLCSFILFIKAGKYEDKGATIKTLLLEFCRRKLLGSLKSLLSNSKRFMSVDPLEQPNRADRPEEGDFQTTGTRKTTEEKQDAIWKAAWAELGERCRNLLTWRKLNKWSNEQIAKEMPELAADSVTAAVNRCFNKIKVIVDRLKMELWN